MTNKKSDILWRIYLVYFLTVAFGIVIIAKVVFIQFIDGEKWKELARNSTMRYVSIDAVRGDILADDGRLLATSVPVYEIRMDLDKTVLDDDVFKSGIDSLTLLLSRLFNDRSAAEYKRLITLARVNKERYFLLKRNVSYNQLVELRNFPILRLGRFKGGLLVVERNRREAPFKSLASRTIGFEREGVYVGLEGAYREYLEGVQGKRLMQRISGGNWMPVNDENEIRSQNGKDIITTLNLNMQDIAESALMKQLNKFQAHHGTVVIMEVSTGKVKAISNLTRNAAGNYEETFNYAIGESAEPGSTFKLASMIALLEDDVVSPDDFIQTGDGKINYADQTMRDSREGGFGTITVKDAFALSSNVGISMLVDQAYRKNPVRFTTHLSNLLLDQPLGIEIKGEGRPFIPKPNEAGWSGVTLPWMSIGYNLSLTPLQILAFYNAVANDGTYMKPMFVEEVRQTGKTIKRFEPQVVKQKICSQSTLKAVREMLEEVVEMGTGSEIKSSLYKIAGKTGTALVAKAGGGYRSGERKIYRASFAGYFPADNPRYSMIVMIHDPRGWIFTGSQVSAPVFREIADKIFATQINVNDNFVPTSAMASLPDAMSGRLKDLKEIYSVFDCRLHIESKSMEWANARIAGSDTVMVSERKIIENLVPNVVGMGLMDALYVLENAGIRVRFNGRGMVRSQSIKPGTRITRGSEILIQLS
jgi:cell division protein FtsI (penicillin-binding protein 3)